ncbi:MAG: ferredoxin [Chloroflexi bacterium]|nr:ferredoxin [Chloroflexota bacterium]
MPVRVHVDPDLCIGSAECVRILPEAFRLVKARGVSVATDAAPDAGPQRLDEAVRSCPTGAISVSRSTPGDPDDRH